MIMNLFLITLFTGFLKLIKSESSLSCILSLEMISSSIILLSSMSMTEFESNFMMIVLISFIVLEGVLGLSIFVFSSRSSGNDYLKSINLLKY